MGIKAAIVIFTFSSIIARDMALECYACGGSEKSDCALGKRSMMVKQNCDVPLPESDNQTNVYRSKSRDVCIKFYDIDYKPKLFARGCARIPVDINDGCKYLSEFISIDNCKTCSRDLCNIGI